MKTALFQKFDDFIVKENTDYSGVQAINESNIQMNIGDFGKFMELSTKAIAELRTNWDTFIGCVEKYGEIKKFEMLGVDMFETCVVFKITLNEAILPMRISELGNLIDKEVNKHAKGFWLHVNQGGAIRGYKFDTKHDKADLLFSIDVDF